MRLNNKKSLKLNKTILTLLNEATVTPNSSSTTYISSPSGIGVGYNLTPQNLNPANWNLQPGEDRLLDPNSNNESQPRKPGLIYNENDEIANSFMNIMLFYRGWQDQWLQNNPPPQYSSFPNTPEGLEQYQQAMQAWANQFKTALQQQPWYSRYKELLGNEITPSQLTEFLQSITNQAGEIEWGLLSTPILSTGSTILAPIAAILGDVGAILWLLSEMSEAYDEVPGEVPLIGHQFWLDVFGADRPDVTWSETAPYYGREVIRQFNDLTGGIPSNPALNKPWWTGWWPNTPFAPAFTP